MRSIRKYQFNVYLFLICGLFIGSAIFITAQAQTESDPGKIELIQQLIDVTHADSNLEAMIKNREYARELLSEMDEEYALFEARATTDTEIDQVERYSAFSDSLSNDIHDYIDQLFSQEDLRDILVTVYDQYYSAEDIKNMIAFYNTPTGQKVSQLEPDVNDEILNQFSDRYEDDIQSTIERMFFTHMLKFVNVAE